MKKRTLSGFFLRWRWVICSAAALFLSVMLLFLFPRKEYPAVSTVFAILFWLSAAAMIGFAALAVRNGGTPPHDGPFPKDKIV